MAASAWVLCVGPDGLTHAMLARLQADPGWPDDVRLHAESLPMTVAPEGDAAIRLLKARGNAAGVPLSVLLLSPQAEAAWPVSLAWRQALTHLNWPHAVLTGDARQQVQLALQMVRHDLARARRRPETNQAPRWRWVCADCDDGECEQHWMPGAGA